MSDERKHLFDDPRNVKRVIRGLLVVCAVLVLLDLVIQRKAYHPWEEMFGFYAVYGFVGCVVLVLLAKVLRRIVMRSEDFYDPTAYPPDAPEGEEGEDV